MGCLDCGLGASQLLCTGYAFSLVTFGQWVFHSLGICPQSIVPPKATGCKNTFYPLLSGPPPPQSWHIPSRMQLPSAWEDVSANVKKMDIGLGFGLPQWQLPLSITITFINFAFHFSSSLQLPSVEMLAVKRQL